MPLFLTVSILFLLFLMYAHACSYPTLAKASAILIPFCFSLTVPLTISAFAYIHMSSWLSDLSKIENARFTSSISSRCLLNAYISIDSSVLRLSFIIEIANSREIPESNVSTSCISDSISLKSSFVNIPITVSKSLRLNKST